MSNKIQWSDAQATPTWWHKLKYKKWDGYLFYSSNLSVVIVLADLSYAKNAFITLYEKGGEVKRAEAIILPWSDLSMSQTPTTGDTVYRSSDMLIEFKNIDPYTKSIVAKYLSLIHI